MVGTKEEKQSSDFLLSLTFYINRRAALPPLPFFVLLPFSLTSKFHLLRKRDRRTMYAAEPSLLLPFFEGFFPPPQPPPPPPIEQLQQLSIPLFGDLPEDFSPLGNLLQPYTIFEYDIGGEGDLFKAPEPIIEEKLLDIDLSTAMSIMSDGDDVINNRISIADMQTIQNDHFFSNVFYECTKDFLQHYSINESVHDEPAAHQISANPAEEAPSLENGRVHKSVSFGCLNSAEWINGGGRPNFLEFHGLNFESAYGMRRAYSEGDIQKIAVGDFKSEERRQKLSRYMKKKAKRNFCRKIKYACRKASADSQPRLHGRFARTEEFEISKQQK